MNNKGQALVMFVLLIPILVLLIGIVFDIGNYLVQKNNYTNEIKDTIRYSLKKDLNEDEIKILLDKNIGGNKEITKENNTLKIKVTDKISGNFIKDYEISISFIGYKENENIIIKKEGDLWH